MNDQSVNELWSLIKDGMQNTILENTKSELKLLPAIAKGDSADGMVDVLLNGSDANDSSQIMTIPNMTGQSIAENDNVWVAYMYSLDNAYVMYTADQFTNGMPEWAIASELAQSIATEALTVDGHDILNGLIYKGTLTSADDLDNINTAGVYWIDSSVPTNSPIGASTYCYLLVINRNATSPLQAYLNTSADTQNFISMRRKVGNPPTWKEWFTVKDVPFARGTTKINANADLNDFTTAGVYYCSSSADTQSLSHSPYTEGIWVDGATGFRLEVYNTTGTGYGLQILYTHNVVQRTYMRSLNGSTWRTWRRIIGDDEIYYRDNDTLSITTYTDLNGFITSSTTSVSFSFYTPKSLANISSVTVTAFKGTLRGISGYLDSKTSAYDWFADSAYTVTATKISDNMLRIVCTKSSAYTNVTNNTPVSYYGSLGLSFSTT